MDAARAAHTACSGSLWSSWIQALFDRVEHAPFAPCRPLRHRLRCAMIYTAVDIVLTADELYGITRYRSAAKQLAELHRQGFCRARLGRVGGVVLERAHYEAVCASRVTVEAPHVRPPKLRMA